MYDEDDDKEELLKMLGGEVDDFAGSKLSDPDAPTGKQGVTIEISVKPHGGPGEEASEEDAKAPEGDEEHDPIAHILGMCGGGCPGE